MRTFEKEIMDDIDQVLAYAKADFSASNQAFVLEFLKDDSGRVDHILDIGCGTADVLIRLAKERPSIRITAVDASGPMLDLAGKAIERAGLSQRLTLHKAYLPGLPFKKGVFDAILAKDVLHHLPDPMVLWEEIKRLSRPGTVIFIMDLVRQKTRERAKQIVEQVAGREDPILKDDFYRSLLAAFTIKEVRSQIRKAGLGLDVVQFSERHFLVKGRYEMEGLADRMINLPDRILTPDQEAPF